MPVDPTRAVGLWTHSSVRDVLTNPKYTGFMVWNRRATKDKLHPGKYNPRDEWIMSSQPEHPALVSVERFLEAQTVPTGRERSRSDADPAAPNRHRQTNTVYRLRSYVHCVPCQRRMHGKTSRQGHTFSYCQPRGRARPDGHPATVAIREEALLAAVTDFFNTHLFGPDRIDLARASLPAATEHIRERWERKAAALRRHAQEIDLAMDNLVRQLEKTTDSGGALHKRISKRMHELDQELADAHDQLAKHEAVKPPEPAADVTLLDYLPLQAVDLNHLATDRLRRFLDAFQIEIHYDHNRRRATLKATLSSDTLEHLTRLASQAAQPTRTGHKRAITSKNGPTDTSRADDVTGHSSVWCPRQESNLRHTV